MEMKRETETKLDKEFIVTVSNGLKYTVSIIVIDDSALTITVEDQQDNSWSGKFSSEYIEEISHKAGNYKNFSVFIKMLISALSKDNSSVFMDILTSSDLEKLKAARKTNGSQSNEQKTTTLDSHSQQKVPKTTKRYAILSYANDFDRVHYPLPLSYEDTADPIKLKRTISKLREELSLTLTKLREREGEGKGKSGSEVPLSGRDKEKETKENRGNKENSQSQKIISNLRKENLDLRNRLR